MSSIDARPARDRQHPAGPTGDRKWQPAGSRRAWKSPVLAAIGLLGLLAAPAWWFGLRDQELAGTAQAKPADRMLDVRWLGVADKGLPVEVAPLQPGTSLAVGAKGKVVFRFKNLSDKPVTFQAVHHVAPGPAAEHFHKYECFCFSQQRLGPRESKDLPVGYRFDDRLPEGVRRITISYTLFPLDAGPHAGHDHGDGSHD